MGKVELLPQCSCQRSDLSLQAVPELNPRRGDNCGWSRKCRVSGSEASLKQCDQTPSRLSLLVRRRCALRFNASHSALMHGVNQRHWNHSRTSLMIN